MFSFSQLTDLVNEWMNLKENLSIFLDLVWAMTSNRNYASMKQYDQLLIW